MKKYKFIKLLNNQNLQCSGEFTVRLIGKDYYLISSSLLGFTNTQVPKLNTKEHIFMFDVFNNEGVFLYEIYYSIKDDEVIAVKTNLDKDVIYRVENIPDFVPSYYHLADYLASIREIIKQTQS